MKLSSAKENSQALQNFLGLNKERSEKILGSSVLISCGDEYQELARFLKIILERTFEKVNDSPLANSYGCEVVLYPFIKRTDSPSIFIGQDERGSIVISKSQPEKVLSSKLHSFLYFLSACYTAGLVLKQMVGSFPFLTQDEIVIDISRLIKIDLAKQVDLGLAYLAGAGAIGNSFLLALSTFSVKGEIKIVDPDTVSDGNLNRCLFFNTEDISRTKVEVLVAKAQPLFENLKLTPVHSELAKVSDISNAAWLRKLIVGVDSRRTRRNLQTEVPGEVFDASTTGISEVVIHHHKRPLSGACLGCVYVREKQEEAHELHVAEVLGVSIEQVRCQFIDDTAAELIAKKYSMNPRELIGLAFDTLFKQLCGEGKLVTAGDKQVLAPLAFVSALAGAFLALMLVEKHLDPSQNYNYWKFSPWASINYRLKQILPSNPECEFCNNLSFIKISKKIWG